MTQGAVIAVQRALRIFESFAHQRTPMTLTQLASSTETPKSTCHAIVNTLVREGYLYTFKASRTIYPTKKAWDVARSISDCDLLMARLLPIMERIRDQTCETVILGKRQGDSVTYLDIVESQNAIRYMARPGDIKPLHSSAIGKALLCDLPEGELRALLKKLPLHRATPSTITSPSALKRELKLTFQRGYAMSRGENVADVSAVAILIDVGGEKFALAVAGPSHRLHKSFRPVLRALNIGRDELLRG